MSSRNSLWLATVSLVVVNVFILLFVLVEEKRLTVSFLDVGQGDAIFIESPSGRQLLIDGGRDRSVLRELGRELGVFDRSIDVVIATHPDADHIGGLPGVFQQYRIGAYIYSDVEHDTTVTEALEGAVQNEHRLHSVVARRGMRVDLGDGAYADILFPDRDVRHEETNAASVFVRVVYGNTSFMLTGDAPEEVEAYVVSLGGTLESDVLKAGHHGSRTSSGETFLEAVNPSFVVVSAGKDNAYGHPHEEVVARIQETGATLLATSNEGAIRFVSDGAHVLVR